MKEALSKSYNYLLDLFQHLLEPEFLYPITIGAIILILLWMYYRYKRASQGIIPYKTQGGNIEIAPSTLRGVMQHAANSIEGVERASCRHFIRGRGVGVKVAIHVRSNSKLREIEAQIKGCIRATLFEQFGMEIVEPINIRVTKIVGDPVATPKEALEEESDMGPTYLSLNEPDTSEDDRPYADETKI
ncbi:MAG: hypothetical protein AB3N63_14235 [Puniceicoccaceae bacterium]